MIKTSRQLKALARNLTKGDSIQAQIIMRNYVMERFLERISLSKYRNNFILKGGMLVSAMAELPQYEYFITDDELNAALSGGSGFAGGKGRIYEFFQQPHTQKEKADFLKDQYGTGGRSHALSGATASDEDHNIKLLPITIVYAEKRWKFQCVQ